MSLISIVTSDDCDLNTEGKQINTRVIRVFEDMIATTCTHKKRRHIPLRGHWPIIIPAYTDFNIQIQQQTTI